MPGFLIIAHAPLASALKEAASHTYSECAWQLEVLDVAASALPEEVEAQGRELLARVRAGNADAIIFTDAFGATPCSVAQRLAVQAEGGQVKVIAGVNVPMLWRSLCYRNKPIDEVVELAVAGALQGVMQVSISKPQNQTVKPMGHDQNKHQNQQ